MKPLWITAITIMALTGLSGCGGDQAAQDDSSASAESAAPTAASGTARNTAAADTTPAGAAGTPRRPEPSAAAAAPDFDVPEPDVSNLPFTLQTEITSTRRAAERDPSDAQRVAGLGALYYVHADAQAALKCFEHCVKVAPEDMAWQYYVALTQLKLGNDTAAIAALRTTLEKYATAAAERPNEMRGLDIPARLRLADLLVERDPAAATKLFDEVLEVQPGRTAALFGKAQIAQAAGQTNEALALYQRVVEAAPTYGPAHAALADIYAQQGNTARAERHRALAGPAEPGVLLRDDGLAARLRQRGLNVDSLISVAGDFLSQGDFEQAEAVVQQAIDFEQSGEKTRTLLGRIRQRQGRVDDAITEYQAALEIDPTWSPARARLALAYMSQDKLDEAEAALKTLFEKDPGSIEGLSTFARLKAMQEQVEQIQPKVDEVLRHHQYDAVAHYTVGMGLLALGRIDEGQRALQQAVELNPQFLPARFQLGMVLKHRGDVAAARAQWQAGVETMPTDLNVRGALCESYFVAGEYEAAVTCLSEGLEKIPNAAILMNMLAWIRATAPEAELRDGAEAVKWAERANELTQFADPLLLDTLACAYAEAGEFDQARRVLKGTIQRLQQFRPQEGAQRQQVQELLRSLQEKDQLFEQKTPYRDKSPGG
jgi:tetratricopeptide (TPR) repeat protein